MIRPGGGSPGSRRFGGSLFAPDGYGLRSAAVAALRSGEVGERSGPCPGFGARKTLGLKSAEHLEFPDRMVGVGAHATSSA